MCQRYFVERSKYRRIFQAIAEIRNPRSEIRLSQCRYHF